MQGASSLTSSDSAIQGPMQQSAAIPESVSTKDNALFTSSTQAVTPKITTKANIAPTTKPPPPTTTTTTTTTTTITTQSTTTTTTTTKRPTTKTTTTTTTPRPTTTSTASSTTSEPRTTTRLTTKTLTTAPPTTLAPSSDPVLCDDTYCSTLSYEMLGRMNTSVDPCTDFYSYSCGAWISGRKILLDMNVIDQDRNSVLSDAKLNLKQKIREMLEEGVLFGDSEYLIAAKLHYQSCMDSNTRFDSGQG
ncbi:integumentary mucin C.1-like [Crassostrea angulata]|uniref:integumentary mucin C.1-like n=1 Tax=Magallana angulata TaxID=2784310 RepID=UPI0022B0B63D|nr:integumentary mucin C.1-like [Crassostrea angulata]